MGIDRTGFPYGRRLSDERVRREHVNIHAREHPDLSLQELELTRVDGEAIVDDGTS